MANSKTDEQDLQTPEVVATPVETSNPNTRSYFFPNDGQSFSCEATSLEEAEKKNREYLKQLEGDK